MSQETYNENSIQVLDGITHIRTRPGMYIGSTADPRHLFNELLDNAIDEAQNGYSKTTRITYLKSDNSLFVRDFGRGIPIGKKKNEYGIEEEIVEVICTKMFSGGKFSNKSYTYSSGLNGLGLTCCNALSEEFIITTIRDGKYSRFRSKHGKKESTICSDNNETQFLDGVAVRLIPDKEIFDSPTIPESYIIERCNTAQAFGFNIDLEIDYKTIVLPAHSLIDLIPLDEGESEYFNFTINVKDESTGEELKAVIRYGSNTNTRIEGYTNMLYNRYGGTHTRELNNSIQEVWSEFSDEAEVNLKSSDFLIGCKALVAVFIRNTAFDSQTKERLTVRKKDLDTLMNLFKSEFRKQLVKNPEIRKALIKRFEEYRIAQNKLSSRKEILSLVKINQTAKRTGKVKRRSVVANLVECTSQDVTGTELFLTEGLSASGVVARARDKKTQAVLPLRGKLKNTAGISHADVLKSETVRNIVNSLGCGIGEDIDVENCRYEKIIINSDSDSDGKHICALICGLFMNHLANVVRAGRLYVVEAPFFRYDKGGKSFYVNSFDEMPEDIRSSGKFTRFKGLGEMDDDEFKLTCMTPGNRKLYQVEFPNNLEAFNRIMSTAQGRREVLITQDVLRRIDEDMDDTDFSIDD